jgi:hypothetical protein
VIPNVNEEKFNPAFLTYMTDENIERIMAAAQSSFKRFGQESHLFRILNYCSSLKCLSQQ